MVTDDNLNGIAATKIPVNLHTLTDIRTFTQVISSVAAPHLDFNAVHIPGDVARAINETDEFHCVLKGYAEQNDEEFAEFCPTSFDSVLCWPRSPRGTLASLQCLAEFRGVQYDTSNNATRFCHPNGTWDNYSNYDRCSHVADGQPVSSFEPVIELPTIVYYAGYSISLIALVLAVAVFTYFKDLRCLRNTIHANLFVTYIMAALLWILTLSLQIYGRPSAGECIVLVTLLHYFSLTNFFWMLVEGLYLYMLVVETFTGDTLKFALYATIGWGGPAVFVLSWFICKMFVADDVHVEMLNIECSWMRETSIDWIFQGPSCAVLIINLIFLLRIMWVLITKLRSANTVETRQYRKASKALLVLLPLLGITYLVVLAGPNEGVGSYIFVVTRAVLLSTQGFSVALLYCFLNSEVRSALRHRMNRWKDARNIGSGPQRSSKRLLTSRSGCKRESCVSSTTTTTVLVGPTSSYAVHHRDVNGGSGGGGVSSVVGGSLPMSAMPKAISPLMKRLTTAENVV